MIELMIAVTLALTVSAAVLAVFVASRSSFLATSGTAALADGGRFALDFIQNGVRSAGYMACNTTSRQTTILAAPPSPIYTSFGQPAGGYQALGGYEANGTAPGGAYTLTASPVTPDAATADWSSPTGVAPGGLDPALAGQVVKGNDVLVVYSTLQNAQAVYVTAPVSTGDTSITVNLQGSLTAGQLATISDCAKSMVMWISSVTGGNTVNLAAGGWPNNTSAAMPLSFEIGSQVAPIDTTVFYIGKGADGDGALFSYDLNAGSVFTANELVPDIEAMQVLYGVDTTGTQIVAEYMTANQVIQTINTPNTNFNNVLSVKVAVLAASPPGGAHLPAVAPTFNLLGTTVTAPIDTRARQVFEMTIGLRDLAP